MEINSFSRSTNRQRTMNFNTVGGKHYAQSSSSSSSSSSGSSFQQASVNLDAEDIKYPQILSINTSTTQLVGTITANGKVIKQLNSDRTQLDLSTYLKVGKNTVEISARYTPVSSAIAIEFSGSNTKIVQQARGNGVLTYVLTIAVL